MIPPIPPPPDNSLELVLGVATLARENELLRGRIAQLEAVNVELQKRLEARDAPPSPPPDPPPVESTAPSRSPAART